MNAEDRRHGTNAGYIAGCHDECCRTAHADYKRNRRTRLYVARTTTLTVPALGTHRRIRALMAIGWRLTDIDREIGRGPRYSGNVLRKPRVYSSTAAAVDAAYERLCMTPGPSDRTRKLAKTFGWVSALAWDDIDHDAAPKADWKPRTDLPDTAVIERFLAGDDVPTTRAEREAIVARWRALGRSLHELEARTGWRASRYYEVAS